MRNHSHQVHETSAYAQKSAVYLHGSLLYCGVAGALDVCDNNVINTIFNKYFEGVRERDINFIFFPLKF